MTRFLRIPEEISDRLIMWLAILAASVSVSAAGIAVVAIVRVGNQAERAEKVAAENCWRSKTLAAYAIRDFGDRSIYPAVLLPYARASVPKTCPPIDPAKMPPREALDAAPQP